MKQDGPERKKGVLPRLKHLERLLVFYKTPVVSSAYSISLSGRVVKVKFTLGNSCRLILELSALQENSWVKQRMKEEERERGRWNKVAHPAPSLSKWK
ncbi:MAG: hypothetical protein VST71_10200 [Nitrospirota bacterium]|nr:hypothetical protein [Nitrospirota bacterium]